MERSHAIVIGVFIAALALFGLKLWSDHAADSDVVANRAAKERLARAGGGSFNDESDSWGGSGGGGSDRAGAPGERGSMRPGSLSGSGSRMGGGADRRGGSADVASGGSRAGSGVGYSAGSRMIAGGSGGTAGGGESGHLGPSVQQKDSLVHFLGSQPATQSDLANLKPDSNGTDNVALKLDTPDDIAKQGGQEQNVQAADNGDGIKITDTSDIKFPNNVNPQSASISFSIEPDWAGSDASDNALMELRGEHDWSNRIELVKNGEFLRFIVTPDSGQESDISVRINDWQAGQEHQVQASYDTTGTPPQINLYIDGKLAGTNPLNGSLVFPNGVPVRVGGDWPGSNYQPAGATFRNFQITNTAPANG
jgi:hypothetical protein